MLDWMLMPYRRYADFSGRSQRKEYWMFALLSAIVTIVILALMFAGMPTVDEYGAAGDPGIMFYVGIGLLVLFGLGSIVPSIAVQVRRFHDQDKSGWFVLLGLIPYVGGIVVFVFMCLDGTHGTNRFGADPKDHNSANVFS